MPRFWIMLARWTPRGLALAMSLLLTMFAAETWSQPGEPWQRALGVFMQLLPALVVLVASLIGWLWPRVGGGLFLGLAGVYVWMLLGSNIHWTAHLAITLPLVVIGLLFCLSGYCASCVQRAAFAR